MIDHEYKKKRETAMRSNGENVARATRLLDQSDDTGIVLLCKTWVKEDRSCSDVECSARLHFARSVRFPLG